jgi:hypothetical protein
MLLVGDREYSFLHFGDHGDRVAFDYRFMPSASLRSEGTVKSKE